MITFLCIVALSVVCVWVFLALPFLWKRRQTQWSHHQLNAAIYRDQFARLERDLAEKMLSEPDYEQAKTELQRRILTEVGDKEAETPALRAPRKTLLALGVLLPVCTAALYLLLGTPVALQDAAQPRYSQQDIDNMIATLAHKLESEPNNPQGWAMLVRSYKALGRHAEAEAALVRAGAVVEKDAELLALYADITATNANGNLAGKPLQLLQKALKLDPENAMALWLLGTAAYQGQDYAAAIRTWEHLAKQMPPGSEDGTSLQSSIDDAREKLGKAPANANANVSGVVEVDVSLKSRITPGDTVLVIARIPGQRMPVAVLRASATALPLQFTLDDTLSMSPQALLSAASEVEIEARISKSGMAMPESGDLLSVVQTVKVGARGLKLRVVQVRP